MTILLRILGGDQSPSDGWPLKHFQLLSCEIVAVVERTNRRDGKGTGKFGSTRGLILICEAEQWGKASFGAPPILAALRALIRRGLQQYLQ